LSLRKFRNTTVEDIALNTIAKLAKRSVIVIMYSQS
jgi:hypothetical protein